MELDQIWLSIIPAIIALIVTIIAMLMMRYKRVLVDTIGPLEETVTTLEELNERLSMLEVGKSTNAAEKVFLDRLSEIEEMLVPLKESPKFSSPEYSLLQYQINKLKESREHLQNRLERMIEQNFNSFRSEYNFWMLIVTLLFTFAIGLLIYLLPK